MRTKAASRMQLVLAVAVALILAAVAVPAAAQEPPGVTLEASRSTIEFGDRVRLHGAVSRPAEGETVSILDTTGRERATAVTDAEGVYSVALSPLQTTTFQARWLAALSEPTTVKVRPKVRVSLRELRLFGRARVTGLVRPVQEAGRVTITLDRNGSRVWERRTELTRRSRFHTGFAAARPGALPRSSFCGSSVKPGWGRRSTSTTDERPSLPVLEKRVARTLVEWTTLPISADSRRFTSTALLRARRPPRIRSC